jgi:hypothetical protein
MKNNTTLYYALLKFITCPFVMLNIARDHTTAKACTNGISFFLHIAWYIHVEMTKYKGIIIWKMNEIM